MTNDHRLGSLKQQEFIPSHLEAGSVRSRCHWAVLPEGSGQGPSCLSQLLVWPAVLGVPSLVAAYLNLSSSAVTWTSSPYVSVSKSSPYKDTCHGIQCDCILTLR